MQVAVQQAVLVEDDDVGRQRRPGSAFSMFVSCM